MGTLDETRSTYTYDTYGNVLERLEEGTTAHLEARDAGPIVRREGQSTRQHQRFDYIYDDHGNWTDKVSWMDTGEGVTRAAIERREFQELRQVAGNPASPAELKLGPTTRLEFSRLRGAFVRALRVSVAKRLMSLGLRVSVAKFSVADVRRAGLLVSAAARCG